MSAPSYRALVSEEQTYAQKAASAGRILESGFRTSGRHDTQYVSQSRDKPSKSLLPVEALDTVSSTRLYLGNLSREATVKDVEDYFRPHGPLKEIKILNGFGFVEYADAVDARNVVPNGMNFMGERLKVKFACVRQLDKLLSIASMPDSNSNGLSPDENSEDIDLYSLPEFQLPLEQRTYHRLRCPLCDSDFGSISHSIMQQLTDHVALEHSSNTVGLTRVQCHAQMQQLALQVWAKSVLPEPYSFRRNVSQISNTLEQFSAEQSQLSVSPRKKRKAEEETSRASVKVQDQKESQVNKSSSRGTVSMKTLRPQAFHYTVSEDCSSNNAKRLRARFVALERFTPRKH